MSILVKGTDFGATEQVTSTKLDNLVDAAKFTDTSETAVSYTGSTGTCLQGGGLEVTSNGQLQIEDGEVDLVKLSTALKNVIHPVGIILETTEQSTAAAFESAIGFGTWEAYGSGRVTVGIDSGQTEFDTIQETGGAKTHTLDVTEIPAHTHNLLASDNPGGSGRLEVAGGAPESTQTTESTGGGGAHNNLQPYIVVYRYRRTA